MKKNNSIYTNDIVASIEAILKYTTNFEHEHQLVEDQQALDAVLRRIQIIGEAAKKITPTFREKHKDIPWKSMAGLRDVVVHNYDDLKIDRIWPVIKDRLPVILEKLRALK